MLKYANDLHFNINKAFFNWNFEFRKQIRENSIYYD